MKTWLVFNLLLLCSLGLTDAGQEIFETINLFNAADSEIVQAISRSAHPFAVHVSNEDIDGVSSSVLKAETWLRTHVLSHFPAAKITTIVVGETRNVCQIGQNHNLGLVLPSVKNIYYSLTRWGLEREIKVSPAFPSLCFDSNSALFRDVESVEKITKPLLQFLHSTNSTYSFYLPSKVTPLSDDLVTLESFHANLVKKFGSLALSKVNLIISIKPENGKPYPVSPVGFNLPSKANPLSFEFDSSHANLLKKCGSLALNKLNFLNNRKLTSIKPENAKPYPVKPIDPFPQSPEPPLRSSIGFSVPSSIAKNPHPPTYAPPPFALPVAPPPMGGLPFAPEQPPFSSPAMPPFGGLPPCNPAADTPAPVGGVVVQELWCVAKPSVPAETLQEALDYACGEGGASCDEIKPSGNCYYPDTVVAHSSYAFNSYYQKYKRSGGTCSFGGTAMLIASDPSYLNCRFRLS